MGTLEAEQRRRSHQRAPSRSFRESRKNIYLRIAVIIEMKIREDFKKEREVTCFED